MPQLNILKTFYYTISTLFTWFTCNVCKLLPKEMTWFLNEKCSWYKQRSSDKTLDCSVDSFWFQAPRDTPTARSQQGPLTLGSLFNSPLYSDVIFMVQGKFQCQACEYMNTHTMTHIDSQSAHYKPKACLYLSLLWLIFKMTLCGCGSETLEER